MPHQVTDEDFWKRDPRFEMASASGKNGVKRLEFEVSHYYRKIWYVVTFDGKPVELDGDGGLREAIEAYNAIDEGDAT
jgi:hypothetical protein